MHQTARHLENGVLNQIFFADMKLASKKKIAGQKRRLDSTGETSSTSTDDNSKPGSTE